MIIINKVAYIIATLFFEENFLELAKYKAIFIDLPLN